MATYRSFEELEGKTLKLKDEVIFEVPTKFKLPYLVETDRLSSKSASIISAQIFIELRLDKAFAADLAYGYESMMRSYHKRWPVARIHDYEALTRLVLVLFKKCEEFNTTQNVSKEPMKEQKEETLTTVDPLSSFKEGDLVKIIDNDHPNMSVAFRPYAGQWFKVEDILSSTLRINSCKDGQVIYITPDLIAVHYRKNSFNTSLSDFDSTVEELSRKYLESLKKETVKEMEEETIQEKPFTIQLSYEEVKLSLKKPVCKF